MKHIIALGLTAIVSAVLGAAAVQGLHAQAKPPAFIIVENTITNPDAYAKEYLPLIQKAVQAFGGKYLARGGKILPYNGTPPKEGVVITQFESLDKAQAYINSQAVKDAIAIGSKYATLRAYVVEGLSP
jgi:uncharacterized protein (DUF1330 family)